MFSCINSVFSSTTHSLWSVRLPIVDCGGPPAYLGPLRSVRHRMAEGASLAGAEAVSHRQRSAVRVAKVHWEKGVRRKVGHYLCVVVAGRHLASAFARNTHRFGFRVKGLLDFVGFGGLLLGDNVLGLLDVGGINDRVVLCVKQLCGLLVQHKLVQHNFVSSPMSPSSDERRIAVHLDLLFVHVRFCITATGDCSNCPYLW